MVLPLRITRLLVVAIISVVSAAWAQGDADTVVLGVS